jgi:hypothetical protein
MKNLFTSTFLGLVGLLVANSANAAMTYSTISVADYVRGSSDELRNQGLAIDGDIAKTVRCYSTNPYATNFASFTIPLLTPTTSLATGDIQVDLGYVPGYLDNNNHGVTARLTVYNDMGGLVADTGPISSSNNVPAYHFLHLQILGKFTPSVHRAYLSVSVGCDGKPGTTDPAFMTRVHGVRYWYSA